MTNRVKHSAHCRSVPPRCKIFCDPQQGQATVGREFFMVSQLSQRGALMQYRYTGPGRFAGREMFLRLKIFCRPTDLFAVPRGGMFSGIGRMPRATKIFLQPDTTNTPHDTKICD